MPDSQVPPLWGPAYDERDLEALLSGQTGSTPVALQPVESILAALRAAATRRELFDEPVARAGFRAFRAHAPAPLTPATQPWTAPEPWASAPEPRTSAPERAAVTDHTLVLPSASHRPQPAVRHRHRRPRGAAVGPRRPGIAVTGAAAAALIVMATVVTGALTGSIGGLASFGRQPASASAPARATDQSPVSQGLQAAGAREQPPTPKPTAAATPTPRPTSGPGTQCRDYFAYLEHPAPRGGTAWISWITLQGQLIKQAGSPLKIDGYCLPYLDNPLGAKGAWPPPGTPTGGDGPASAESPATGGLGAGSPGNQGSGTSEQGQSVDHAAAAGRP